MPVSLLFQQALLFFAVFVQIRKVFMKATPTARFKQSRVIKNSPIYYGWIILMVGTFGAFMTMPGQTLSVGVFLDYIIADLGFTRTRVSDMYAIATLTGSFALPFVGRFIDKRGPRLTVIIVSSLFALACVFMGLIQGIVMLFIGFVLIRSLGQGALSMVSTHVINIWFVRRRGLAVGLSGLGGALGIALFPKLINFLLDSYSWRTSYMLLGLLVAVTILPLGAWLFRGHPELFGLEPDGSAQTKPLNEENFTASEAKRTLTFWIYVAAIFTTSALGTALIFHNYDILAEQGLGRDIATQVFVPIGFVLLFANITTGYLVDRFPPRFLLSIAQALLAAVLIFSTHVTGQTVLVYGILFGLMQGMLGNLSSTVFAYYFGRKHLGSIKGQVATISVAGSAFGPTLFSRGKDFFGEYEMIVLITAAIPLVIALIAPFVKPPHKLTTEG